MAADTLAPYVAMTSATMILNIYNMKVLAVHEERF